jgi:hypothetical protein
VEGKRAVGEEGMGWVMEESRPVGIGTGTGSAGTAETAGTGTRWAWEVMQEAGGGVRGDEAAVL